MTLVWTRIVAIRPFRGDRPPLQSEAPVLHRIDADPQQAPVLEGGRPVQLRRCTGQAFARDSGRIILGTVASHICRCTARNDAVAAARVWPGLSRTMILRNPFPRWSSHVSRPCT